MPVTVKVLKPFKHRGEVIPPGTIIEVPTDALPKLTGYVIPSRRGPAIPAHLLPLADESARRFEFCQSHRRLLGGGLPTPGSSVVSFLPPPRIVG